MAAGNSGPSLPCVAESPPGANVAQWLNNLDQNQLRNVGDLEILNNSVTVSSNATPSCTSSRAASSMPPPSPGNAPLNCSGGSGLDGMAQPNFNNSGSSGGGSCAGGQMVARPPNYGMVTPQRACPRPVNLNISGVIQLQGGNGATPPTTPVRAFVSLQPNVASPGSNFVPPAPYSPGRVDFHELSQMSAPSMYSSGPPMSLIGDRMNALNISGNSGLSGMGPPPSFNSSGEASCGRDGGAMNVPEPCVPCDGPTETIISGDGAILAGSPRPPSVPAQSSPRSPIRPTGEYLQELNLPPLDRVGIMREERDFSFASSFSSDMSSVSQRQAHVTPQQQPWSPASVPSPGNNYTPAGSPIRITRPEDIFRTPPRPDVLLGENFNFSGAACEIGGGLSGMTPPGMVSPGSSMGPPGPLCGDNIGNLSLGSGLSGVSEPRSFNSGVSEAPCSRPGTPGGPAPCSRPVTPCEAAAYNQPGTPGGPAPCSRPGTPGFPNFDANAFGASPGLSCEQAPSFNDSIDSYIANNPMNASGGSGLSQMSAPQYAGSPVASPVRDGNISAASAGGAPPSAISPGVQVPVNPPSPLQPNSPMRPQDDYYREFNLRPVERQGIFAQAAPRFDSTFSSAASSGNSTMNRALPLYSPGSVPSPLAGGNYTPAGSPHRSGGLAADSFRTPPRPDVLIGEKLNFSGASMASSGLAGMAPPNLNDTFSSIHAPSLNDSNGSGLDAPMFPTFYSSFSSDASSCSRPGNSTEIGQEFRSPYQASPNLMQFPPTPDMIQFSPNLSIRSQGTNISPLSDIGRAAAIAFGTPPRDIGVYPSPLLGIRRLGAPTTPGSYPPSSLASPALGSAPLSAVSTPGSARVADVSAMDELVRDARSYYLNMSGSPEQTIGGAAFLDNINPGPAPNVTPNSTYDWSGFFNTP